MQITCQLERVSTVSSLKLILICKLPSEFSLTEGTARYRRRQIDCIYDKRQTHLPLDTLLVAGVPRSAIYYHDPVFRL